MPCHRGFDFHQRPIGEQLDVPVERLVPRLLLLFELVPRAIQIDGQSVFACANVRPALSSDSLMSMSNRGKRMLRISSQYCFVCSRLNLAKST